MLGDVCENRNNGFNLLRVVAATGILAAHCMLVIPVRYDIESVIGRGFLMMTDLLLAVFFVFSGFLITASLERSQNLLRFTVARVLRIFPGLIVVAAVLAFIVGPVFSTVGFFDYFTSAQTWAFVPSLAIFLDPSTPLPGLFETHPVAGLVDLSVWTLRYEVIVYAGFPFAYLLFLHGNKGLRAASVLLGFAVYIMAQQVPSLQFKHDASNIGAINILIHFSMSFLVGASIWMYRRYIPNSFPMLANLWLLYYLSNETSLAMFTGVIAAGYTIIWLAFLDVNWMKSYNRFGDYSYGLYIIHFPVGQVFYQLNPDGSPVVLTLQTFVVSLGLAMLLWKWVEKPALAQVNQVEGRLSKLLEVLKGACGFTAPRLANTRYFEKK